MCEAPETWQVNEEVDGIKKSVVICDEHKAPGFLFSCRLWIEFFFQFSVHKNSHDNEGTSFERNTAVVTLPLLLLVVTGKHDNFLFHDQRVDKKKSSMFK